MIPKRILVAGRLRRPPATGWSWLDRRFLREHGDYLSREAVLLYLFLRRGRPSRVVVLQRPHAEQPLAAVAASSGASPAGTARARPDRPPVAAGPGAVA